MNSIFILIILVPIIEIYLFIKIGSQIGAFTTILLIFITAILGIYYAKYEGLNTLKAGFFEVADDVVGLLFRWFLILNLTELLSLVLRPARRLSSGWGVIPNSLSISDPRSLWEQMLRNLQRSRRTLWTSCLGKAFNAGHGAGWVFDGQNDAGKL